MKTRKVPMKIREEAKQAARVRRVMRRGVAVTGLALVSVLAMSVGSGAATTQHSTSASVSSHAAKTTKVAFKGSYSGTIALLWNSSSVTVSSVKGTGTATTLGSSTLSGSGTGQTASTCDPFGGSGSLVGGGSAPCSSPSFPRQVKRPARRAIRLRRP